MKRFNHFSNALVIVVVVCLLIPIAAAQEGRFEAEIQAAAAQHATDFERISSLAVGGDVKAANKQLIDLTRTDKSPSLAFLAANMLYKMDPQASFDLHKKVYEAKPDEPSTCLEWAMELHRKGEYAQAIPLYQKVMASKFGGQYNALLAECLIRQGKTKEAVAAWEAAGHGEHHTSIDFAICEIHGDLSPLRRRSDLRQRLAEGENQVAEHLIDLDLHMDQDWWNSRIDKDGVTHDLSLVEKSMGKDSARFKEIECWAMIASQEEPKTEALRAELMKAGLVIGNGNLPQSSFVAGRLIGIVLDNKIESAPKLFERFEKELTARAKSTAGDVEALNLLCGLSVGEKTLDRLAEYDRYGWERFGEFRFAGSLLGGLAAQKKLSPEDPDLKKALKQFPESSILNRLQIQCVDKEMVTKEMLVSAIESEYHNLSPGLGGYPDSYTLKGYFFMLAAKL